MPKIDAKMTSQNRAEKQSENCTIFFSNVAKSQPSCLPPANLLQMLRKKSQYHVLDCKLVVSMRTRITTE